MTCPEPESTNARRTEIRPGCVDPHFLWSNNDPASLQDFIDANPIEFLVEASQIRSRRTKALGDEARKCGGLDPDNLRGALEAVRPWGVDSYSRTNLPSLRKDLDKVRAFVEVAR